jgi:DNA (cytosine-5)-methyltransferase 1
MKENKTSEARACEELQLGVFSFFSGAGLLDLAFEDLGFETLAVNEISEAFTKAYFYSRETLGRQLPKFGGKICTVDWFLGPEGKQWLGKRLFESREEGYFVGFIGGPPCPDFSVGGKNRGRHGDNGRLSESYVDVICAQRPDWFLFENVKGLWRTAKHRTFFEYLKGKLKNEGYQLSQMLLNSIQFGAPQDRDRIFLFGVLDHNLPASSNHFMTRNGSSLEVDWEQSAVYSGREAFDFPWPTTSPFGGELAPTACPEELTVGYWFNKNNVLNHPNAVDYFKPRAGLSKFQVIAEGDDSRKSFKRLHRARYSPTVCYGNNEVHLHPCLPRRISVAEALALQSMPSNFVLPPDMTLSAMFKTVGNGVPYLLGTGVAKVILSFLSKTVKVNERRPNQSENP